MKYLHIDTTTNNIQLFDEYVEQGKDIFILIYLEGCGPCNATRPKWQELENELKEKYKTNDNLVIMEVDQELLDKMTKLKKKVAGFPTIMYIKDGKEEEYDDDDKAAYRSLESFKNWIDSKVGKQNGGKRRRSCKKRKRSCKKRKRSCKKRKRSCKKRRSYRR
jgi:thiol-disulfide isomerase/thioredoxin